MKKLALTLCVIGSAVALSACDTAGNGNIDTAAPYEMERTASGEKVMKPAPVKAERTFRAMQAK